MNDKVESKSVGEAIRFMQMHATSRGDEPKAVIMDKQTWVRLGLEEGGVPFRIYSGLNVYWIDSEYQEFLQLAF